MPQRRIRRSAERSRELILEAAEQLLVEGGPQAVQVRAVAERVGITDAGVNHHFGARDDLVVALLRHGGRRLRRAVEEVVDDWAGNQADLTSLVEVVATVYRDGYGELAVALHGAGWRDAGSGMLETVVQAVQRARRRAGGRPKLAETRLAVAALHQALALDPVYGGAFRRSAGIDEKAANDPSPQLRWWAKLLTDALGLEHDPSTEGETRWES